MSHAVFTPGARNIARRGFLFLAVALLAAAQTAREHVERGYALAQRGDLKAAEAELREAVRLGPEDALALAALGMVLSRPPTLAEADTYLEHALRLDPSDIGTRYNLAANQVRLGLVDKARANLERILEQKPKHPQAAALLATIRSSGGYKAALEHYRAGRFAESQALLDRAIAEGSRDPRVFGLLAWCHHRQDRSEEALAAIRRAIELAPADSAWYSQAAQILLEQGNVGAAYGTAAKALELAPNSVHALKLKGRIDYERGALKQALALFERAVALDASDSEALEWLGMAQRGLFQYAEAAATFEKGIARFPSYARLYAAYGSLLLDPGYRADPSRATALLNKALALDAALADAHYELGRLLLEGGQAAEGLRHLETAVKLDPRHRSAHLALAGAYRAAGRPADQARELQRYRELAPSAGEGKP